MRKRIVPFGAPRCEKASRTTAQTKRPSRDGLGYPRHSGYKAISPDVNVAQDERIRGQSKDLVCNGMERMWVAEPFGYVERLK